MNWRNDIDVAVEKIKQVTPAGSLWEAGDLGGGSSAIYCHIAVILNSVVSGDLAPIEAAEARARELEAALPRVWEMGRDAGAKMAVPDEREPDTEYTAACRHTGWRINAAIARLTPPTDLAERIKGGGQ